MPTRVVRMSSWLVADQHVAPGGAAFLRQAGRVLRDDALAFDVRRHAQQLADGDDAGAADAGHHDAPGLPSRRAAARGSGSAPSANGDARLAPSPSSSAGRLRR